MIILLAILSGMIITIMNVFNGQLSFYYGEYLAIVIIHLIGLITLIMILIIKKEKITFQNRIPLILYSGGMIGVFTVLFNVMTVQSLGASLLTVLGLLGQMITSIILEYNGWLGIAQSKLNSKQLMSLMIIIIGIGVMML